MNWFSEDNNNNSSNTERDVTQIGERENERKTELRNKTKWNKIKEEEEKKRLYKQ